ncbi:hypothetical protein GBA52_015207 [Prunus armeniaca]|nr:hypothetical protein GBA52_015207 [Prunus armeniaca]
MVRASSRLMGQCHKRIDSSGGNQIIRRNFKFSKATGMSVDIITSKGNQYSERQQYFRRQQLEYLCNPTRLQVEFWRGKVEEKDMSVLGQKWRSVVTGNSRRNHYNFRQCDSFGSILWIQILNYLLGFMGGSWMGFVEEEEGNKFLEG